MTTRYIDNTKLAVAMGLQPGEAYEQSEECYTNITKHHFMDREFEAMFDEMAGPLSQWKAFCLGIGTISGLEREKVIDEMKRKIWMHRTGNLVKSK